MQTKVIIFDFDGTLTNSKSSTWVRIWQKINKLDLDYKYYLMYKNGEFNYNTWLEKCFLEYKASGYSEQDLNELVNNMSLIKDIEYVFNWFNEKNIKIYILSGGLKIVIEKSLKELTKFVKYIEASNFLFNQNGQLDKIVFPTCNPENKQEFVNLIIKNENVNPSEVLFVGNGKNDETVYKTGVNTLCLNHDDADYKNKKIWHNAVETETLKDILPFISC